MFDFYNILTRGRTIFYSFVPNSRNIFINNGIGVCQGTYLQLFTYRTIKN